MLTVHTVRQCPFHRETCTTRLAFQSRARPRCVLQRLGRELLCGHPHSTSRASPCPWPTRSADCVFHPQTASAPRHGNSTQIPTAIDDHPVASQDASGSPSPAGAGCPCTETVSNFLPAASLPRPTIAPVNAWASERPVDVRPTSMLPPENPLTNSERRRLPQFSHIPPRRGATQR